MKLNNLDQIELTTEESKSLMHAISILMNAETLAKSADNDTMEDTVRETVNGILRVLTDAD